MKNQAISHFLSGFGFLILVMGMVSMACAGPQTSVKTPEIDTVNTQIALGIEQTLVANTLEALNHPPIVATQADQVLPTQPAIPTWTAIPPTASVPPTQPAPTTPPEPTKKLPLVTDVTFSTDEFYCYDMPNTVTVTVTVTDINKGMALYYRLKDKQTGSATEWEEIDLHRASGNTRTATLVGGMSDAQNVHFPPMMHESWLITQIIADDGSYRSDFYSTVTFHPCGQ